MIRNSQIIFAAFTRNGVELALKISSVTGGQVYAPARFNAGIIEPDLKNWTGKIFHEASATFDRAVYK